MFFMFEGKNGREAPEKIELLFGVIFSKHN